MGTSLSKTQLLTELRTEQAAWEALLDEIGEAYMTQPEVAGGWSINDIVAHITGWRRRTVNRFRAALDPSTDMIALWPADCMRTTSLTRLPPGYTSATRIAPWPTSSTIHTRLSSNWSPPSTP